MQTAEDPVDRKESVFTLNSLKPNPDRVNRKEASKRLRTLEGRDIKPEPESDVSS